MVAVADDNFLRRTRLVSEEAGGGEAEERVHKTSVPNRHIYHEPVEWIVGLGVYVQRLSGVGDEVRK